MGTTRQTLLSEEEQTFVAEYLRTKNCAESARVAVGHRMSNARPWGRRVLAKPEVKELLVRAGEHVAPKIEATADAILEELSRLAFANIGDFITVDADGLPQVDFSKATPEQLASIASVSTKKRKIYNGKGEHIATEDSARFSIADKYKGLHLLGQQAGLFKQEEQRVVVDVADRLLAGRARLLRAQAPEQYNNDSIDADYSVVEPVLDDYSRNEGGERSGG